MRLIFLALAAAACTNPDGAITIDNQYTGACAITFAFGDEPTADSFQPVEAGTTEAGAQAGIVEVRLRTTNTICAGAQTCQFADSGLEGRASCRVYAAGDEIGATVTIVDGVYRCPNTGADELIPVVDCGPGGVKH